jgi:hypothetical protein
MEISRKEKPRSTRALRGSGVYPWRLCFLWARRCCRGHGDNLMVVGLILYNPQTLPLLDLSFAGSFGRNIYPFLAGVSEAYPLNPLRAFTGY